MGKVGVAEKPRLELFQVVFQEDVPPELLSFVLSFQKRKYIKNRCLRKAPFLMTPVHFALQPPSVIFSRKCHLTLFSAKPARVLRTSCKSPSERDANIFPAREQYNTPARSAPFLFTLNSKKHPFGCLFHCSSFSIISAFLILPSDAISFCRFALSAKSERFTVRLIRSARISSKSSSVCIVIFITSSEKPFL